MIGSVTFYFLIQKKHSDKTTVQPSIAKTNNDVAPGKYKAMLTLADGSTIILDSAKTGTLVQQGSTNVSNQDGKLIYKEGNKTNKVLFNTLSTAKAQTYATVLSDGTKVWLNSESSIHYPVAFTGEERKVEITGEAYFEVAHQANHPFIVSTGGMDVEVLGTHFNINSYADEPAIKTTLLEGKVRIHSAANNAETILKPGEQALIRQGQADNPSKTSGRILSDMLRVTKDVDVDAEVAWRFGYFNFNNVDLKTMMRQLERWYDVDVEYEGQVPDIKFLGEIPRELTLSQVLNGLGRPGVHFKVEGKKIIVGQ
jgi:ferric-dicitrate binding protein FerR (iron transport regulator)